MAIAFLGVQLAVFGIYMGISFAPNHIGVPIVPADVPLDFLDKQVVTSRNVSGGWWMTALMGGLNYQIEHYLSPTCPARTCAGRAPSFARTAVSTTSATPKPRSAKRWRSCSGT